MKNYLLKASEYKLSLWGDKDITLEGGIRLLIIILIALTPVFSIGEIIDLFLSRVSSRSENSTPIYIKGIKDVGFLTIIFLSTLMILRKGKYGKYLFYALLILFLTVSSSIFTTIFFGELSKLTLVILVGIRWLVPFLITFFIVDFVSKSLLKNIAKVLFGIFCLHLTIQVFQLIFMGGYYGINSLGLAARVPGIFLIPNSASFFTIIVSFFQLYFGNTNRYTRVIYMCVFGFSVIITQSGAGFVVYFILVAIHITSHRLLRVSVLMTPIFSILLLLVFAFSSSRGDRYLEGSGGVRLQVFKEVISDTGLFSTTFGVGTNAATIFKSGELMDSQIASTVYNLGILFSILVFVLLLCWSVLLYRLNNKMLYSFTSIYLLMGATSIFFEAFPMNLLFSVMLAYLIKQENIRLFY